MIDWSCYRIPINYKDKIIKSNPPLSEEEFEKEFNSPFKIKKYHYNFRHEEELTEDNLKKTFVNMCTTAFFHNKEKTIRVETLNLDAMNSKEKEEIIYKMQTKLESLSKLAINNESFFSKISNIDPL